MDDASPPTPRWSGRSTALSLGVTLATVAAFFHAPLFGDAQFFFRDASRLALPTKLFMVSELSRGALPLWFPYEAGGVPFIGELATGVFHPLNLVYALFSFPQAFALNYVGAYLLAALGTWLLLRVRGAGPVACAAGALAFALSGPLVSQSNLTYLSGQASAPLALAAVAWLVAAPSAPRLLAAGAALSLPLFAGEPQSLLVVAALCVVDALLLPSPGRARRLALVAVAGVACAGLCAVQLAPALETLAGSARLEFISAVHRPWSLPPVRLVELVAPSVLGKLHEGSAAFALFYDDPALGHTPWSPSVFLGPTVLILAAVGARDRRNRALAVAAVVLLWLALGPAFGLERVFTAVVPLWRGFRFPEKLVAFVALCTTVLAGHGVDAVTRSPVRRTGFVAVALAAAGFGGALVLRAAGPASLAPLHAPLTLALGIALVLSLASAVVLSRSDGRVRAMGAAALVALPLLICLRDEPRLASTAEIFVEPWTAEALRREQKSPAPPRVYSVRSESLRILRTDPTDLGPQLAARALLDVDFCALYGVEGFADYLPSPDLDFSRLANVAKPQLYGRVLRLFGVEYLLTGDDGFRAPSGWEEWRHDEASGVRILRPRVALPRVFVARSVEHVGGGVEAASRLLSPQFHPGDAVVSECTPEAGDTEVLDRGQAQISAWRPDEVTVHAQLAQAGLLVLNDTASSGWAAFVDGKEEAICRTNGFVRGVRLGPGDHEVVFRYQPRGLRLGALVTAFVLAVLVAAALLSRRRRRPVPQSA